VRPDTRTLIEACATGLYAQAPGFTRLNLFFAVRRVAPTITTQQFEAAVSDRLPGLIRDRAWRPRLDRLKVWPPVLLVVDRPSLPRLFAQCGVLPSTLAVTCIDGTPAPVIEWLRRGFRRGRRSAVLYLHDSTTVVYPFALEPVATLLQHGSGDPFVYADIGLPPLGAPARRFGDASLGDALIHDVEAIPPAALLRYCARFAEQYCVGRRRGRSR
jgi:hypothetical protein